MAVIGSLSVKLGLVTVEWDQATAKAKAQARDLQKAFGELTGNVKTLYEHWKTLGGGLSITAIGMGALIDRTLEFSNQINDLSLAFGVSIEKTLQFRDALQTSGGNAEKAGQVMGHLFSKIEEARSGNEATIAQFEKLGVTFQDLVRMNPSDALIKIFDGLEKLGSQSTYAKIKAIKDLLGKGGLGLSVDEVAAKLRLSSAEYATHAANVKKLGEVSDNLKTSLDNLTLAFADMIGPLSRDGVISINQFKAAMVAITSAAVIGGMIELVSLTAKLIALWEEGKKIQMATTALQGTKGIAQLAAAGVAYVVAKKMFDSDVEKAVAEADASGASGGAKTPEADAKKLEAGRREGMLAAAKVTYAKKMLEYEKESGKTKLDSLNLDKFTIQQREVETELARELAGLQLQRTQALAAENLSALQKGEIQKTYRDGVEQAYAKEANAIQFIINSRDKEVAGIKQQTEFARKLEEFEVRKLALEGDRVYLRDIDYKIAVEQLATEQKIAELQQSIIDAKEKLGAGASFDAEKARIEELINGEKRLSEIRKDSMYMDEYRRKSFNEGWEEAIRKFAQDAQNYGALGANMFNTAIGNMNSAIDNFVKTGKFSFKDFAQSIIQDTMAMILKFQAMQLVMMSLRALGFGGFGAMGGSASVGSPTAYGGGVPGSTGMMASGGETDKPVIVGENGPELFIPGRRGTVIPNMQATSMGGAPQVVYNGPYIANLSAIDTQSGIQFLAKNKNAVWAANQSAQRSLPMSK